MANKELRELFDAGLHRVWATWGEFGMKGSPFKNLDENTPFWDNAGFNYDVGWVEGIATATGWPLKRPGPREWSPRDR